MATKNNSQLQIRIDSSTKKEAKRIFDNLGLEMSAAIKLFLQQSIKAKNLPFEIIGENGLTLRGAENLRESIVSAKESKKTFKTGSALIKDALQD